MNGGINPSGLADTKPADSSMILVSDDIAEYSFQAYTGVWCCGRFNGWSYRKYKIP